MIDGHFYVCWLFTDADWHWCKVVLCKLIYSNNTCTNWAACIVCTTTERYFMTVMRCCKIVTLTSEQMFFFWKTFTSQLVELLIFSHCMVFLIVSLSLSVCYFYVAHLSWIKFIYIYFDMESLRIIECRLMCIQLGKVHQQTICVLHGVHIM